MKCMRHQQLNKNIIFSYLDGIADPEIPVISIVDLGIVRDIEWKEDFMEVHITPTYTGCPAMDTIASNIRAMLQTLGFTDVRIQYVLSPAWTTDWITEKGKRKLEEYGIAPPDKRFRIPEDGVACPLCRSENTRLLSAFGATACKALYQCGDCSEPFEYFKCH